MTKIDVFYFERSCSDFEKDWINELLPIDLKTNKIYASSNDMDLPDPTNPCIVISNCHTTYIPFIEKLEAKKINYGVIQLSDETLGGTYPYINYPHCKFVARNYVHPVLRDMPHVFNFGLGYIKDYNSIVKNIPMKEKTFAWGMAGQFRQDPPGIQKTNKSRADALKTFANLTPNNFYSTQGFSHPNRYTPQEYREFMSNCQFSLCPYGHVNNDTFRIYESLEAGCIPIALKNSPLGLTILPTYWHAVFNLQQTDNILPWLMEDEDNIWRVEGSAMALPFVCEDTWEECLNKVEYIIHNNLLEETQHNCSVFWNKWKEYWKMLFKKNIEKLI